MGELNILQSDVHDTPEAGYQKLYPKSDEKWYHKKDDGTEELLGGVAAFGDIGDVSLSAVRNGAKPYYDADAGLWKNEPLPLVSYGETKLASWAPTWAQLEALGNAVFFAPSTGELTFTLPDPALLPNDGMFRGPIYSGNFGAAYPLVIDITGAGAFSDGLTKLVLARDSESVMLGAVNGVLATTWMRISRLHHHMQLRRAATWAASNFSSPTALPFDTEDHAGNDAISSWAAGQATRMTVGFDGQYHVSGFANIDSTGGISSWTMECWLRKNGTTEITGTRLRTGNYNNEDQAVTLPRAIVELEEGDYLEWVFDHSNLTGNMHSAQMSMELDY